VRKIVVAGETGMMMGGEDGRKRGERAALVPSIESREWKVPMINYAR
jgi:hypothetical protein